MEISEELRQKILSYYEANKEKFNQMAAEIEASRRDCAYIEFPVFVDGVLDSIRYNVGEKRFDEIKVAMAVDGVKTANWLPDGTAYCDEIEYVSMPLPKT